MTKQYKYQWRQYVTYWLYTTYGIYFKTLKYLDNYETGQASFELTFSTFLSINCKCQLKIIKAITINVFIVIYVWGDKLYYHQWKCILYCKMIFKAIIASVLGRIFWNYQNQFFEFWAQQTQVKESLKSDVFYRNSLF